MSTFLEQCACNGDRPQRMSHTSYFYRDALLTRMLGYRRKVRYLLAPAYFGKSCLAASYAQMVFDFNDVFWVNGKSPCFLRDLDEQTLGPDLLRLAAPGGLAVIDDVPPLNRHRAANLWRVLNELLAADREVIVCATPGANPLGAHERSMITFTGNDLLYSEDDFDRLCELRPALRAAPAFSHPVQRVPGLVGGEVGLMEDFLVETLRDFTPAMAAVQFAMLALRVGTFDEVEHACGFDDLLEHVHLQQLMPYFHINTHTHDFSAEGFPLKAVSRAFSPRLRIIAREVGLHDASTLPTTIAEMLLGRGEGEAACELMSMTAGPRARLSWLQLHQDGLHDAGNILAAETLFESAKTSHGRISGTLHAASYMRRTILSGDEAAVQQLVRQALNNENDPVLRMRCGAVAALLAGGFTRTAGAVASSLAKAAEDLHEPCALATFWQAYAADQPALEATIATAAAHPARDDVWALAMAMRASRQPTPQLRLLAVEAAQEHLARVLANNEFGVGPMLLTRVVMPWAEGLDSLTSADVMQCAHAAAEEYEARLRIQRSGWRRAHGYVPANVDPSTSARIPALPARKREAPRLVVRMFGRFQVCVGEDPVPDRVFTRQKIRAMMALLAMNPGADIPVERVEELLWPESPTPKARRNMYSTLSKLRHALMLPNGECPYLSRAQNVVRLYSELVDSDYARLTALAHSLSSARVNTQSMMLLLEQMREIYVGELLPGNHTDSFVISARSEMCNNVVDAALQASDMLLAAHELRPALAFARQAVDWNPSREDSYAQLMRLQATAGQRPAAVDTWRAYRSSMRNLGLDASEYMEKLYHNVLEGRVMMQEV